MSSMIFQPLLYDPLGWKPSKSTYVDHFKWRKYRTTSKDRKISTYGQQYQREQQKKQLPLKPIPNEQLIDQVILVKKRENQSAPTYRYSPSKTPVLVVECQKRPVSANEETTSNTKLPPRPPTAPPVVVEEKPANSVPRERPVDANNDNSRHWLTYPNPRTPQYIIDIKQRLGQLRIPSTLARPSSASNREKKTPTPVVRPASASVQRQQQKPTVENDQYHFLTFPNPQTPDDLRAVRNRLDKHRYQPSLDNYPLRPQTCPVRTIETAKPVTPEETTVKTDIWIPTDDEKRSFISDNDTGSFVIQMVDCDGLPNEYVDALETSNIAQEEYLKNLDRRQENVLYRLPENTNDSFNAYQNQQTATTDMNSQLRQVARTAQNDFGAWVRNATDKERASAMKILNEVLNQPVTGYENASSMKTKTVFKQAPAPPPVRTVSATRKLGRTRTQHKFPCEICEKLLIKRHVWDLSGSETLTCPHHPQGIQVRS